MATEDLLLAKGKIRHMDLNNRMVMAAMGNKFGTPDGYMNQTLIDYYVERAKGGVGMIVTQTYNVSQASHIPVALSLYNESFIPELRKLTDAVHNYDTKICAQLIRRTGVAGWFMGRPDVSHHPVFIPSELPFLEGARGATIEEIDHLLEDFAEAARRVKEAGFDAVEIHGCHGLVCTVSSFMSPFTNRRKDRYGGSPENRARFGCELIERCRKKVGADYPILFRMNASDGVEGGKSLEEAIEQAVLLENAGADSITISSGMEPWTFWISIPPYKMPPGITVPYAAAIKPKVKVRVMVAGRINVELGERILKEGKADYVAFGRPLLADPYLPNKVKEGRTGDITRCIYCNNCMQNEPRRSCTVNPFLFREAQSELGPAGKARKVIVAGGGLAGMQAAKVLAQRGHRVILYEKTGKLGGQFNTAAMEEDKKHFSEFVDQLTRKVREAGVDVRLNHAATGDEIKAEKPDAVIISTGAVPMALNVPGISGKNVFQALDVIAGKTEVGRNVAVVGGKFMGIEIALSLAKEGKKVSLVTRRKLGRDCEHTLFMTLRDMLIDSNIPVYQNAPVVEITDKGVYFLYNGEMAFVKAETVVLAVGSRSVNGLAAEIKKDFPGVEVYEIGDSREPRNALAATNDATDIALKI